VVKGTYTILLNLPEAATVSVGALGEQTFPAGYYAYTGSAFGPGGLARVDRHMEIAAGDRDARHWHVDYLLGHPASRVAAAVKTAGADVECEVSRAIETDDAAAESVAGLGASDCDCDSHLRFAPDREPLERDVRAAHAAASPDR